MGSRHRPQSPGLRHGTVLFFLTLFALGVVGACTDILGINDRTLTGGAAGSMGGGGSGGSGGTGGIDASCATDADCAGSPFGEKCDPESKRCVECLPGPGDTCALGLFCDVTKVCTIGCADAADCNANGNGPLTCDEATHQCKGCGAGAPCPAGTKCNVDTMTCVPGCDLSADCPTADWACCNKQCRNVTKDVQNCGACEDPCVPDQSTTWLCLDGGCVFQSCLAGWANCDSSIAKGNGCETNTQSDPAHCGDCKTECAFPNADAGCSIGNCTLAKCNGTFQNCDDVLSNGCEADTTKDAQNCGSCGASCDGVFPNADATCANKVCKLSGCKPGFGDCDANPQNGCETITTDDPQHCGSCAKVCALDHASQKCEASKCGVAGCDGGFADCNGLPADGCEAQLGSDALHCGTCDNACDFAHAASMCNGGACGMGACDAGWADCNGLTDDGCEKNVATDPANCGGCGHLCASANGAGTCTNGDCTFACLSGFGDCDKLDANGCETNLTNTVEHCQSCGNACVAQGGGTPYCFGSLCGESICPAGKADCNASPGDGCETNITLPNDCGSCGHHCSTTNGNASCNGSTCSIACNTGYGNCNNNVADGCEQPLTTTDHCTSCGTVCARSHAVTSCGTGTCQIVGCDPGWADCNNIPSDGCEANLDTSLGNCGACGSLCAPANGVGACVAGACTIQNCNVPFGNCNGGVADGCEVNLFTDALHCGTCPNQCSFPNAGAACASGQCQIGSCSAPFANCDNTAANGCEANLQSSALNCGSCGTTCASINGTASCGSFMCSITCNSGFKNCNGQFDDGCEKSIQTLQDCGDCGVVCDLPHATESCGTGACQIQQCDAGFTNCDGITSNGCECAAGCVNGTCQGCGDGSCNPGIGETCMNCQSDCGSCPFCGDLMCNGAENCSTCAGDCGACCGNASCDTIFGENCASCATDCGSCCGNASCEGIFNENCMTCPDDCGVCVGCGDGSCTGVENCQSCPDDCAACCGNGLCDTIFGENCAGCPGDCGVCAMCGDGNCTAGEDCFNCAQDCCPTGSSSSSATTTTTVTSTTGVGGGDAGAPCPPQAGVACMGNTCGGPGCCFPAGAPFCTSSPTCLATPGTFYTCDDASDCGAGNVCCHTAPGGSVCTSAAACTTPSVELCTTPSAGAPSCECTDGPTHMSPQKCCPAGPLAKDPHYPTCVAVGGLCK